MSSAQLSPDRPLLRIHQPIDLDRDRLTLRAAYEEFLVPEIAGTATSTRSDYARFVEYWEQFEKLAHSAQAAQTQPDLDPRTTHPWFISDITSRVVSAFTHWLINDQRLSLSTADKACKAVKRIVSLAGQEGIPVNHIRTKPLRPKPAAKHYLDELQIACLWSACNDTHWPSQNRRRTFDGSGMPPSTFWRSVLIMLRTYGMRVQDLVSYTSDKRPITWGDVSLNPRTPNPEGRLDWELGWLHYTASKTGREYYLPLTRYTRAVIDRLRHHAIASVGHELPVDRPILPCPTGHGLTNAWKLLQATARIAKPNGNPYQLEDFRKTCATYMSEHHAELAYHVCGWSLEGSRVAHRHYINSERTLVEHLPTAPMPRCFDDWLTG